MSTTVLHPNALPGIPWSFIAKTAAPVGTTPFAGTACFHTESITSSAFTAETITQPSFSSESITKAAFANESIDRC